jgi:indolepyruvate ferredoxin oxidoreductase
MKRLRGTRLDLFGYAPLRRIERSLPDEYRGMIEAACARLTAENHARAVALAELPDMIRGYEQIKLDNVSRYLEAARELTVRLDA